MTEQNFIVLRQINPKAKSYPHFTDRGYEIVYEGSGEDFHDFARKLARKQPRSEKFINPEKLVGMHERHRGV